MRTTAKKPSRLLETLVITLTVSALLTACGAGNTNVAGDGSQTVAATTNTDSSTVAATPTPAPSATPTPSPTGTPTPTPTPTPTQAPSAGSLGKIAWNNYCVACHASQGPSKGAIASKTMSAINGGIPQMTYLKGTVTSTDASNIATYAANPSAY